MNVKIRLRNKLVQKNQHLSSEKLTVLSEMLTKVEGRKRSKGKTLSLAGKWEDLNEAIFASLTSELHRERAKDRIIKSDAP